MRSKLLPAARPSPTAAMPPRARCVCLIRSRLVACPPALTLLAHIGAAVQVRHKALLCGRPTPRSVLPAGSASWRTRCSYRPRSHRPQQPRCCHCQRPLTLVIAAGMQPRCPRLHGASARACSGWPGEALQSARTCEKCPLVAWRRRWARRRSGCAAARSWVGGWVDGWVDGPRSEGRGGAHSQGVCGWGAGCERVAASKYQALSTLTDGLVTAPAVRYP